MAVPRPMRACILCKRAHDGRSHRCVACGGGTPGPAPLTRPKRESGTKRGYGRKWRTARIAFLAEPANRICAVCASAIATEVDHIVPHKGDWKLFWRRSNWQGLCKPCHSRKSINETKA